MATNLYELLKAEQNINITVSLEDIRDFFYDIYNILANQRECHSRKINELQDKNKLLSSHQAASLLKVTPNTLCRWHKSDYLTPIKVGNSLRYRQTDIDKILKGGGHE